MNLFYNNIELFAKRFPALYDVYKKDIANFAGLPEITITTAKSGAVTAESAGRRLHSAYNPVHEAQKLFDSSEWNEIRAAVFFSFGLGYAPIEFVRRFPQKILLLVEPDIDYFLTALTYTDWTDVFNHGEFVLFVGAPQQAVVQIIEKTGFETCCILHNKAHSVHNETYFSTLLELIERNKQKKAINDATLEKFGLLWLRNTLRNKNRAVELDSVSRYENSASQLTACLLAAGPSLDAILPHLAKIQKRCIIICADTALKACLKTGCQPHFIIVGDPQYWNIRHLDGLAAPQSVLITELAAYPSVFKFPCRDIVLFSSLYPPGKFIEQYTGKNGVLGAGGSVATTAWDFARFMGCKTIFAAGLDLAFPENKTHFKGATFEERAHVYASRLNSAENSSCAALYGANSFYSQNYDGKPVLTDKRFSLFAWWFESKCAEFSGQKTCGIGTAGLRIPGIHPVAIDEVLSLPEQEAAIFKVCKHDTQKNAAEHDKKKAALECALSTITSSLASLQKDAEHAMQFCEEGIKLEKRTQTPQIAERIAHLVQKLAQIDRLMRHNQAHEIAALVFPTEKHLQKILQSKSSPFEKSHAVYEHICAAIQHSLRLI